MWIVTGDETPEPPEQTTTVPSKAVVVVKEDTSGNGMTLVIRNSTPLSAAGVRETDGDPVFKMSWWTGSYPGTLTVQRWPIAVPSSELQVKLTTSPGQADAVDGVRLVAPTTAR